MNEEKNGPTMRIAVVCVCNRSKPFLASYIPVLTKKKTDRETHKKSRKLIYQVNSIYILQNSPVSQIYAESNAENDGKSVWRKHVTAKKQINFNIN